MSESWRPPREAWASLLTKLRTEYLHEGHGCPWVLKFSAGKDSTLLAMAALSMVDQLHSDARHRPVWVVNNDTLVENPVMQQYARSTMRKIQAWADARGLPINCRTTTPSTRESFWFCLIGLGYPTPWHGFRWCTSKLKIAPSERLVEELVSAYGKVLVLLGVRSEESASRRRSVERNRVTDEARLSVESTGCITYQPIEEWTEEEVWLVLSQVRPPWGGDNRELRTMYAAAAGSEACQVVMFESQKEDCGKGGRFGCWTCTVVERDKSLRAMAEEREELFPYVHFREYLIRMRNAPGKRQRLRRVGQLDFDRLGHVRTSGPFTLEARAELLGALLELERKTGAELLTAHEAWAIATQWEMDGIDASYLDFYEGELESLHHARQHIAAEAFHLEPSPLEGEC